MALHIPRGPDESCGSCPPQLPRCPEHFLTVIPTQDRTMGQCPKFACGFIVQLVSEQRSLPLFEEDPDRRPYLWDLEE